MTLKIGDKDVAKIAIGDEVFSQVSENNDGSISYNGNTYTKPVPTRIGDTFSLTNYIYVANVELGSTDTTTAGAFASRIPQDGATTYTIVGEINVGYGYWAIEDNYSNTTYIAKQSDVERNASWQSGGVISLPDSYVSMVCVTYTKEVA